MKIVPYMVATALQLISYYATGCSLDLTNKSSNQASGTSRYENWCNSSHPHPIAERTLQQIDSLKNEYPSSSASAIALGEEVGAWWCELDRLEKRVTAEIEKISSTPDQIRIFLKMQSLWKEYAAAEERWMRSKVASRIRYGNGTGYSAEVLDDFAGVLSARACYLQTYFDDIKATENENTIGQHGENPERSPSIHPEQFQ